MPFFVLKILHKYNHTKNAAKVEEKKNSENLNLCSHFWILLLAHLEM